MAGLKCWSRCLMVVFSMGVVLFWTYLIYRSSGTFGVLIMVSLGTLITGIVAAAIVLPGVLIEFASWLKYRAKRHQYEEWEGEYISYQDRHLRCWRHGGDLWFSVRDISLALDDQPARETRIKRLTSVENWCDFQPARGLVLNEAGIREWLDKRTGEDARKLLLWLDRNVFMIEARRRMREPGVMPRREVNKAHVPFRRGDGSTKEPGSAGPLH